MKKKTTAANLEARFDAGKDVLDYFDLDNARWGGARSGAGRKASGRVQYVTRLNPSLVREIKARAKKEKRAECEVLEAILTPALGS